MLSNLQQQLRDLAEPDYQKFTSSLIPGADNILGVRVPLLRKKAKEIARGDWRTFLQQASDKTHEELLLQGFVISYAKADTAVILSYTAQHIKKLSNWALCDSFCSSLKLSKKEPEIVWDFIQLYFKSTDVYSLRFAIVMGLYYIEPRYLQLLFLHFETIRHEDYYVKMAIAWVLSICYIKYPNETIPYLLNNTLDDFTYNKTLQKIIESTRIDAETKAKVRTMKRSK